MGQRCSRPLWGHCPSGQTGCRVNRRRTMTDSSVARTVGQSTCGSGHRPPAPTGPQSDPDRQGNHAHSQLGVHSALLRLGGKQQVIKESEAARQQKINEAEGEAEAILTVATATAEGIRRVADALQTAGGDKAMQLRIAEQYIEEFGRLAKAGNTFVVPSNLSDIASMIALATGVAKKDVA